VTIAYKKAYQQITSDGELGLRGFELSKREWCILEELRDVLKDATLFFSRGSPNIATVIPAIDHIDNKLTDGARDPKLDPAIRKAIGLAKRTLNRYYKATDMSATYCIAMLLHPRHKMHYFEKAGWPKHWIEDAVEMLREEYNKKYRHLATTSVGPATDKEEEERDLDGSGSGSDSDAEQEGPIPARALPRRLLPRPSPPSRTPPWR
ncbi:hypothetical protein K466DRAFT_506651, partial [Polyporus arcularius HHB13444]